MNRLPLSGLTRPAAVATLVAAVLTGAGATGGSAAAAATLPDRFAAYVDAHHEQAMDCALRGGPGSSGLKTWPATVRTRVAAQFDLTDIGGYRRGKGRSDHHSGRALDVMVRGERGTEVADWFRANAKDLNVKYVIWQQGYWHPGMTGYRPMADRGGDTANHYDHVHVSFKKGSGVCPE